MKKFIFLLILLAGVYFSFSFSKNPSAPTASLQDKYHSIAAGILSKMAGYNAENGKYERAKELFEKSEKTAEKINDPVAKIEKIIDITQSQIEINKEALAENINKNIQKIMEETAAAQDKIPKEDKKQIFGQSASIYAQIENLPSTTEAGSGPAPSLPIENMLGPEDTSLFLFNVINLYIKDEKIQLAMETIEKITDPYYKKAGWLVLVEKITAMEANDSDLIKNVSDPEQQTFMFLSKLKYALDKGNFEKANNLVNDTGDEALRRLGLWEIASSQIKIGDINSAIQTLKKLEE